MTTVAWWSGGITSAVACSLYKNAELVYIETGSHHPDTLRFKADCERWYGRPITTIQSTRYSSHFDVIKRRRFLNGPYGALCTAELKKMVREEWEKTRGRMTYVWGFEASAKEELRAKRVVDTMTHMDHEFPLIAFGIDKRMAIRMVLEAGIEVPAMYHLGFNNNNCIGCVKGGAAYWNKIRVCFPEVFERMAALEREIGRSCLRRGPLDELDPTAGRDSPPLVMDCGAVGEGCEIERSRAFNSRD
jgi:hypothetical protein